MLEIADLVDKERSQDDAVCAPTRGDLAMGLKEVEIDVGGERAQVLFHPPFPGRATIILVHGLFDHKYVRYLDVVARLLIDQQFGVMIPDMRGHGCRFWGTLPSLGPREAEELEDLARWGRVRYPSSEVGLIGFSLGALAVIHALARPDAPQVFVAGGIVFSPPGDLGYTVDWLDRRPADVFTRSFRRWLSDRLRAWGAPLGRALFRGAVEWLMKRHGAHSVSEFLADADPSAQIPRVSRPLYIVSSLDDPYFTRGAVAYLQAAARGSTCVMVEPTDAGGHIGHIAVYPSWTAQVIVHFFVHSSSVSCVTGGQSG